MAYGLPHGAARAGINTSRSLVYADNLGSANHSDNQTELALISAA